MAERFGAILANVAETDPVTEIKTLIDGRGLAIAIELAGPPFII